MPPSQSRGDEAWGYPSTIDAFHDVSLSVSLHRVGYIDSRIDVGIKVPMYGTNIRYAGHKRL